MAYRWIGGRLTRLGLCRRRLDCPLRPAICLPPPPPLPSPQASRCMSSISRHPAHRRRSHSASSPAPSTHHSSTEKWRAASKRPRPSSSRGTSYKDISPDTLTSKWDVDKWRRGKRPRRDCPVSTDASSAAQSLTLTALHLVTAHQLPQPVLVWIQPRVPRPVVPHIPGGDESPQHLGGVCTLPRPASPA